MKLRDILKLAIQIVGVYFLYQSVNLLIDLITAVLAGIRPGVGMVLQILLRFVAALYFLRGAPPFLFWACKNEQ